jgi:hypothetical protein
MKYFVSSTYVDLRGFREAAIRTLERMGSVYAMEKFFASEHPPKSVCLAMLGESDVVVLIIGERYGTVDEDTGFSMTELEYRTAIDAHIPVLPFLKVAESGEWLVAEEGERADKLGAFRQLVGDAGTWPRVKTPEELATEIPLAIWDYERRHGLLGARMLAFQSPEEFFAPFDNPEKIFTHSLPLVGRTDYRAQIVTFPQMAHRVLLLAGRGGLGKSKLLKEGLLRVAADDGPVQVRLLRDLNRFVKEMANDLPAGPLLVAVDDAHKMRDLETLLAVAREHSPRMQLILATRPQGIPAIRQRLADARFTFEEILALPEIPPLSANDTRALARAILPDEYAHAVDRLVQLVGDSPLVTVVGARLLARREIDPAQLAHAEEAKSEIFDRFRDVQLGEVSDEVDRALAQRIIELASAMGPIRPHHEILVDRAAAYLGIEPHELRRALVVLEDAGALVAIQGGYQVTPDVLADYILQRACVMPTGESTGYADGLFAHFQDVGLDNFLANLVDIQPDSVLDFMHTFTETHDLDVPDVTFEEAFQGYSLYPIRGFPGILLTLSADGRYLGRALDLLWRLGRDDKRPTNPYPDHPMRILEDLAETRADKDPHVYDEVLRAVERWSREPNAFSHRHSPLDVLDKLMNREAIWLPSEWDRANPPEQGVDAVSVADVRRRGIRIVSDLTQTREPTIQHRALLSLLSALWHPDELQVRDDEGATRQRENQQIVGAIQELLAAARSQLLAYTVEARIRPMRPFPERESDRPLCDLLEAIPQDLDARLVRYLRFGIAQYPFFRDIIGRDIAQLHEAVDHDVTAVVQRLVDREQDAQGIKGRLEREIGTILQYGAESRPSTILFALSDEHPDVAVPLAELVVADPRSVLASELDALLVPMRGRDGVGYRRIVDAALATTDDILLTSISHTLYRVGPLEPWERAVVQALANAGLPTIAPNVIRSLQGFPAEAADELVAVVAALDVGSDSDLADELVGELVRHPGLRSDPVPDDLVRLLLPKLVPVRRIGEARAETHELLARLAVQDPERVVEFYLDRIRLATRLRRDGNRDYDPVPSIRLSTRYDLERADAQARHRALTQIADAMVHPPHGLDADFLDDLFALMANGFDDLSMQGLRELLEREGRYGIPTVLHLLREAPGQIVFERIEFLDRLLAVASQAGADELERVQVALYHLAWTPPEYVPGQVAPPPSVMARDRALEAAPEHAVGSLVRTFFENLVAASERQIAFEQRLHEGLNS